MSMQRATRTFPPGVVVTHDVLGDEYVVIASHPYFTQVVTNDENAVDISFPTVDLRVID